MTTEEFKERPIGDGTISRIEKLENENKLLQKTLAEANAIAVRVSSLNAELLREKERRIQAEAKANAAEDMMEKMLNQILDKVNQ